MKPFERSLHKAKVGNKEIHVADGITASELLDSVGENTNTKNLVQISPDGSSRVLRSTDEINFKDGNTLEVLIAPTAG